MHSEHASRVVLVARGGNMSKTVCFESCIGCMDDHLAIIDIGHGASIVMRFRHVVFTSFL